MPEYRILVELTVLSGDMAQAAQKAQQWLSGSAPYLLADFTGRRLVKIEEKPEQKSEPQAP